MRLSDAKQLQVGTLVHLGPATRGEPCVALTVTRVRLRWHGTGNNSGYEVLVWVEAADSTSNRHYFRPGGLARLHSAGSCRRPTTDTLPLLA